MHTVAGRARGLRDSALGKVALLVAVLAVAFVASQSCASRETEVTKEEAVAIARNEIDYEPDRVMTRFIPRGVQSRPNWAVSLSTVGAGGLIDRATVVVIDSRTGDIVEKRVAVD